MVNYYESVEVNHKLNWSYIPNRPYRTLINGSSGSGKTNVLLNLIKHQRLDIGKIYLYVKDSFESKYQLFINRREKIGIKKLKHPKAFTDYSQTIDNVYENFEDSNSIKKAVLIVTESFFRGRKLNISLVVTYTILLKVSKL